LKQISRMVMVAACVLLASATQADPRPLVVTTIHPLTLIASDLAGDWLEVRQLLDNSQEPHHMSLKVSQRKLLNEADLVLWIGPRLETFLARPVSSMPEHKVLAMSDARVHMDKVAMDPHDWLQPDLVRIYYGLLAARLKARFPEFEHNIERSHRSALQRLEEALTVSVRKFGALENKTLAVDHHAYGHYSEYFGITIAGALVDDRGMATGTRGIAELVGRGEVQCLAVEQLPAGRSARNLARQMGLAVVEIDPLGRSVLLERGYSGLLISLLEGFLSCFLG
jgi:zinc transport system substrate-binding protein